MPKYLITGVAGTGKSTLAKELRKRGLAAYDTEEGFSYYVNKETGERTTQPHQPDQIWYESHHRVFDEKILMNLFIKHADEPLFICSITANQSKFYPEFDKLFLLTADNETIIHRLKTRTNNNHFGRDPLGLARVIGRHYEFDQEMLAAGAVEIDSTKPITEVADQILALTKCSSAST